MQRLAEGAGQADLARTYGAAAPWSKFALQRQPSVRQAALEQLPTPMPFTTGSFRACASGSRTANNGVPVKPPRSQNYVKPMTRARAYMSHKYPCDTGSFRACASGSRTANNRGHQL